MFTLRQIEEAHSKVQSGADFPKYIHDLIALGVLRYSTYVDDGHAEFIGDDGHVVVSEAKYERLHIIQNADIDKFKDSLKAHQQGQTNYFTFCENSSEAGIYRWEIDTTKRTCTYYDSLGNPVLEEKIPII